MSIVEGLKYEGLQSDNFQRLLKVTCQTLFFGVQVSHSNFSFLYKIMLKFNPYTYRTSKFFVRMKNHVNFETLLRRKLLITFRANDSAVVGVNVIEMRHEI